MNELYAILSKTELPALHKGYYPFFALPLLIFSPWFIFRFPGIERRLNAERKLLYLQNISFVNNNTTTITGNIYCTPLTSKF